MIYSTLRKEQGVLAKALRFTQNRKKKTHTRAWSGKTHCLPRIGDERNREECQWAWHMGQKLNRWERRRGGHETKLAKRSPWKRQQTRGQEPSEVQTELLHSRFDGCDQTGWVFVPLLFHFILYLLLVKLLCPLFRNIWITASTLMSLILIPPELVIN